MSTEHYRDVPLPNGRTVKVSDSEADWPKLGETGFVPFDAVIPDPNQPRDTTNYTDTQEHELLAASTSRRAQGIIMRVRPFSEQDIQDRKGTHPRARYWIVDGERRYHACGPKGANLGVLEINVFPYDANEDIFLDQVVLNTLQMKLSTPELVRALAKIRKDHNVQSANALATMVNMDQVKVAKLWHMTNLAPDLLELTNEQKFKKHQRGARLTVGPASELAQIKGKDGKTAHQRQHEIYDDALGRGIKGAAQQSVFFMQYQEQARQENRQNRRPKRQRNRIRTLVELITDNDLLRVSDAELGMILSTATRDELLDLSRDVVEAGRKLKVFAGKVQDKIGTLLEEAFATVRSHPVQRPSQTSAPVKPSGPEVPQAHNERPAAAETAPLRVTTARPVIGRKQPTSKRVEAQSPPPVRTSPAIVVREPVGHRVPSPPRAPVRPSFSRADLLALSPLRISKDKGTVPLKENVPDEFSTLRERFREEFSTSAWSVQGGRFALTMIKDPAEYLKIHDQRGFKYQHEGTDRPPSYPDPEEVRKMMRA